MYIGQIPPNIEKVPKMMVLFYKAYFNSSFQSSKWVNGWMGWWV